MKKYLTSFIVLSLCLCANLASAAVVNHDISTRSLTIPASSTDEYVITGSTTSNYVIVEFGWKGTITLKNCYFDFSYQSNSPIRITGKNDLLNTDPSRTNVNLILDGDNYIYNDGGSNACIQVDQGAQINISAIEPCDNSSGTLTALQANSNGGAAIGAREDGWTNGTHETYAYTTISDGHGLDKTAGGNIVISSGTITARGGHGAGIGGGYDTWYDGMIVIYGGVVESRTIRHSAGIGSGCPEGGGVESAYAPNSAIVVLPPAIVTASGATGNEFVDVPELALAGTKVRVYIGDPEQPTINVYTKDRKPNANIYFDLSQDPDINQVVTATIDPKVLNVNSVLLGQTNVNGLFTTTGSLMNQTTFFTDATTNTGNPYVPVVKALPNGGNVELGVLEADFNIRQIPSSMLEYGYTNLEAEKSATVVKISYNDSEPMTNISFDLASGSTTIFSNPIFLASDSSTVIPAPTSLKKGDVYYVVVPIKVGQVAKVHTDVLRILGTWNGSSTGYIRQVITQIVADVRIVDICEGDSYFFNGENLTEPGVYVDTTTVSSACATGLSLNDVIKLVVHQPEVSERYDTICDGKPFVWAGESYTVTGDYTKIFANRYGCDSTVTLHLTVSAPYNHEISDTICAGETYTWDGKKYNETGVYPRKYSSVEGCDSLVTLYLTVGEVYDIEIFDTICDGEVYLWNKVKYTESGSYTQEFETIYGCDSVVTVHLFVAPIVREEIIEAICQGEPYRFGNTTLVKPGVYVDTALSMHGCDSITTLTLRVHEPYLIDQYIEACHNDTFMFRGMLIDEPGIYYDSMLTQHGCDSVYRLIYNKTPTYMFQEEDSICVGSTYNFRGMTLTKPGVYYDSLSTVASGCDSIYKLVLHNFSHSDIYSVQVADVCGDNQTLHLVAQYEGQRPEYYNIIYSQEANDQGFKNIIQVPFTTDTIEAPMPNATPYIHPDYYELTLQLGNYKCPKAVSEHTTDFLVRYPSWIIEQNWQDVVAVLNAQHNGGYTFENYEWYVNHQPASQNKSYLYLPTLRVGDEVELHVMRQGEDYYVPTCPIIIEEQDTYNQEYPTLVTPARVSRHDRQVSLEAQTAATQYYLYDITGRCLLAGVCELGQVQQFELPNVAGSYFLTMVDAENHQQTIHMVID